MKQLFFISAALIIIAACHSSKKSTTSASSPPNTTVTAAAAAKPADGVYAPGNEELTAIQIQNKEVTPDKLKEGYAIYAHGPCLNCHGTKNIYNIQEEHCKGLIYDMAKKAELTDAQRDAVYMYVLSIRAAKIK